MYCCTCKERAVSGHGETVTATANGKVTVVLLVIAARSIGLGPNTERVGKVEGKAEGWV